MLVRADRRLGRLAPRVEGRADARAPGVRGRAAHDRRRAAARRARRARRRRRVARRRARIAATRTPRSPPPPAWRSCSSSPCAASARSWRGVAAIVPGRLVARMSPVGGFLATAATRTAPRRVASAMTPLVLERRDGLHAAVLRHDSGTETARPDARPPGRRPRRQRANGGVPEAAVHEVRATPGVAAATGIRRPAICRSTTPRLGSGYTSLAGADGRREGAARGRSISASARGRSPTSTADAWRRRAACEAGRLHGGRPRRTSRSATARARLRVVATYARSLGFGEFVLPRELAAPHATDPLADGRARAHRTGRLALERQRRGLRKVAAAHPGVRVAGKAALRSDEAQEREISALDQPRARGADLRLHRDRRGEHAGDDRRSPAGASSRSCGWSAPRRGSSRGWRAGRPASW